MTLPILIKNLYLPIKFYVFHILVTSFNEIKLYKWFTLHTNHRKKNDKLLRLKWNISKDQVQKNSNYYFQLVKKNGRNVYILNQCNIGYQLFVEWNIGTT